VADGPGIVSDGGLSMTKDEAIAINSAIHDAILAALESFRNNPKNPPDLKVSQDAATAGANAAQIQLKKVVV
jgi:hypothetical protein